MTPEEEDEFKQMNSVQLGDTNFRFDTISNVSALYNFFKSKGPPYFIDLQAEGVPMNFSGLTNAIEITAAAANVSLDDIEVIKNQNLYKEEVPYRVSYEENIKDLNVCRQRIPEVNKNESLTAFGLFVNKSNWIRLYLSALAFDRFDVIQSFLTDPAKGWETHTGESYPEGIGYDQICIQQIENVDLDAVARFLLFVPITLDNASNLYDYTVDAFVSMAPTYNRFLAEIVIETAFEGDVFFPTEKTFRPIAYETPFLAMGPLWHLKRLKKMGFKTFNNYWSEYYDEVENTNTRMEVLLETLQTINDMSTADRRAMYNDMQPILQHNKQVLLELTDNDMRQIRDGKE